jgi:short-subunit dehydrogenase
VLIGSIAESYPLPMAPTYAATKAGLRLFAEALGVRLARHGVGVTLVSPGFIDTAMSRQVTEPKPFLMSADKAAAIIARGVDRRARFIVLPWQFTVIRALTGLLPRAVLRRVLSRA